MGNGISTLFWVDNWHNLGPLIKRFGDRVVLYDAVSITKAKVCDYICEGRWNFPRTISHILQVIVNDLRVINTTNGEHV